MNIYKNNGTDEYRTINKCFKDETWEFVGELPNRITILRNEAEGLTKEEIRNHLYSTKELLKRVITDIERVESKI